MKKIPLDRIDLWKAVNGLNKKRKEIIPRLISKDAGFKKRVALRALWEVLFKRSLETPFKTGLEAAAHHMFLWMLLVQIQTVNAEPNEKIKNGFSILVGPGEAVELQAEQQEKITQALKIGTKINISGDEVKIK